MIRRFQQHDTESVLKIWLDASIDAHDFIPRQFWESNVDAMRETYLPMAETYVWDAEGSVRGFVSLCGDTLAAIFVSPEFQAMGIGTRLMAQAKAVRRSLNLTVYKENDKSIAFYRKCGFEIASEQIDEHTGHPELVMVFDGDRPPTK